MNLSISIVNWNTKNLLQRCLSSLYESYYKDYEIFVIDNNSTDRSAEMVKDYFPEVELIVNPTNLGFAKANNQAIKLSQGKYILILNPDVIVFRDTLREMVNFMDLNPSVGTLGIKLVNEKGTEIKSGYYRKFPSIPQVLLFYTILGNRSLRNRYLRNRYWEAVDTSRTIEVPQVPGACLMVRRKVIQEVGTFDERFKLFFEDVDWCYRIKKDGWKIFFVPYITAIHLGAQSICMLPYPELASRFFNSMYLYFKKHYSISKALIAKFIVTSDTLLKIAIFLCLYLFSKYKRAKRLEHMRMLWKSIRKLWIE